MMNADVRRKEKTPRAGRFWLQQHLGATPWLPWLPPSRHDLANGENRLNRDAHKAKQGDQRYLLALQVDKLRQ